LPVYLLMQPAWPECASHNKLDGQFTKFGVSVTSV
jgi:hypothetical protein